MRLLFSPSNLWESYILLIGLLRLAGLFPFDFDNNTKKFYVSWKFLSLTIVHILIYSYVNVTTIIESWMDFSQPMIGHSTLTAFGNLWLRLLGIFITFLIIMPLLLGSLKYASTYNTYMMLVDEAQLLGVDVNSIYRNVYFVSCFGTIAFSGLMVFTAWHSCYFYEHITHRGPELKFYLVATLSTFYKLLYIFNGNMQFFGIYMISKQLNEFLAKFRDQYRDIFENEQLMKRGAWRAGDVKVF